MNAFMKSGPWFGMIPGPKYAVTSVPWRAEGTEY